MDKVTGGEGPGGGGGGFCDAKIENPFSSSFECTPQSSLAGNLKQTQNASEQTQRSRPSPIQPARSDDTIRR